MQSTPSIRVSRTAVVLAGVLVSSAWGCAHLPKTGAEATGEPLNVEMRTETHTYTTQAKVGEVVHRDSAGRAVGTSEVYENRTGSYDVQRWQVFQGDTPIDDQDFFRIGGDIDSAKEIAASRQSGMTMNKVGLGLLIGGGAAALGGFILANAVGSSSSSSNGLSPLYYVGYAGMVTVSVGGILTWVGLAKVKREHPIDDAPRANAVAKKYNKSIGGGSVAPAAQDEEEEEEPKPKPKKKKKKKKPSSDDE